MTDVIVIGAGPAGVLAALRSAELGARTTLVASGDFGGMAANDGPVPVRTLAHAARLIRDGRQFRKYGLTMDQPILNYPRLLERVTEVVSDVRSHSSLRLQIDSLGVTLHERAGKAHFLDPHTIATSSGLRLKAEKFIICTGGVNRRLPIPGFELTNSHSDAWRLRSVPPSMLVIGAGATGVQVASIFNEYGTRVQLFEAGQRILSSEDIDISAAVASEFRKSGMDVREDFGTIESFEQTPTAIRMNYSKDGRIDSVEATLIVVAVGWVADVAAMNLSCTGADADHRGFLKVDAYMRTSAPHIFAAGDITGLMMLVPQALQQGFVAGTNAVQGATLEIGEHVNPIGSFTNPEFAQVGLTEAKARETHDIVTAVIGFDETTRTIIDGRKVGFCKLIGDRTTARILGCHVVGEHAVEIVQIAAIASAAKMRLDELARIPLSFPTYAGILALAAASAARQLNLSLSWQRFHSQNL